MSGNRNFKKSSGLLSAAMTTLALRRTRCSITGTVRVACPKPQFSGVTSTVILLFIIHHKTINIAALHGIFILFLTP